MEQFLGLPPDASLYGHQVDGLIGMIHWLMFALFFGWGGFYVYTLVRFRRSRNPKANYTGVTGHTSNYLEVAVAIIEAVLLIGFSIPLWSVRVSAFPAEKESIVVRVVGEQFAWNVHYPGADGMFGRTDINLVDQNNPLGLDRDDPAGKDDITTINQLVLPVNRPVIVHLSSKDVIHSFALPYLRVKQDAIPGMSIPLWFVPSKTSTQIQEEVEREYSIVPIALSTKLVAGHVAAQDYIGKDGAPIVEKGGFLDDELGSLLLEAGFSHVNVVPDFLGKVAMKEYVDRDGQPVVGKGEPILDDAILRLVELGNTTILAAPETPVEIACAQLCGLGHFRMKGFVVVQTEEEYNSWLDEQHAALLPTE
jgi:cytochrome c oxidase subunit 2